MGQRNAAFFSAMAYPSLYFFFFVSHEPITNPPPLPLPGVVFKSRAGELFVTLLGKGTG